MPKAGLPGTALSRVRPGDAGAEPAKAGDGGQRLGNQPGERQDQNEDEEQMQEASGVEVQPPKPSDDHGVHEVNRHGKPHQLPGNPQPRGTAQVLLDQQEEQGSEADLPSSVLPLECRAVDPGPPGLEPGSRRNNAQAQKREDDQLPVWDVPISAEEKKAQQEGE